VLQGESEDFTYLVMPIRLRPADRRDGRARNIRSYATLELALSPGLVLVVGPNGAGKTNLLESLHVGTQGFSPRTRDDAQLVRFGEAMGAGRLRVAARPRRR
jgi:DNA replication and repair protein RecF